MAVVSHEEVTAILRRNPYIHYDRALEALADAAIARMGSAPPVVSLLLDGPPGTGKTALAYDIAVRLKAAMVRFQAYPGCGKGQFLFEKHPQTGEPMLGALPSAMKASHEGPCVLLIDELDKAEAAVDGFFLEVIENGYLYEPALGGEIRADPRNLFMFFSKNDQREIGYALERRCMKYLTKYPPLERELEVIRSIAPNADPEIATPLIRAASILRGHPAVKRPPCSDQIARLIGCLTHLRDRWLTVPELARFLARGLCSDPDYDRILREHGSSPASIAVGVAEAMGILGYGEKQAAS